MMRPRLSTSLQLYLIAAALAAFGECKLYTTRVIPNPSRRMTTTFNVIDHTPDLVVEGTNSSGRMGPDSDSDAPPTFAVVPKMSDNPFFDVSGEGCVDAAERLGVRCLFKGPYGDFDETGQAQVQLLEELLTNRTQLNLQGLAVSVVNATVVGSIIAEFMSLKIPVLTFDSDAPDSNRIAYVGTDNYFFGTQLAKVLKQVHPDPGQFAIVSATSPNIMEREQGVRDHLIREGWQEVSTSPSDMNGNSTIVVDDMFAFVRNHPDVTAIIPVMGAGMRAPDNYWSTFVKAHPEIILVVGDAMPNQLELLDRQQCSGLVGQLPYEMGVLSMDTLFQIYTTNSMMSTDSFIGTNVLEHLLIPLILPELKVDHNLVGELRYVGYSLFASVAAMAVGFACWTFVNRNARVVRVAQPLFLMLVAAGTLLMSAAVLPLGLDDFTHDLDNLSHGIGICMAPFWFLAFGFSLTFSSLFAKIYRVNLLFEAAKRFARTESSIASILSPLLLLSLANGIILTTWTVVSPLKYVRLEHSGTDGWDRAISDYGTCQGENTEAFVIPLAFVNGVMLVFANWIAYKTRRLDEEFSESKYVGMAMASMLQAILTGVPISFVVQQSPQAYYMVKVFMIYFTCCAILLLIFVPKIVLFHQYKNQPESTQRAKIQKSIRRSTICKPKISGDHASSMFSDDPESQNCHIDPSAHSSFFDGSAKFRHEEQAPMGICNCECRKCSCHCHLRNRVSTRLAFPHEDTITASGTTSTSLAPKKPSTKDILADKSSWGVSNLSMFTQSIAEANDDAEASDAFHVEQPMRTFEKPVDVLKDKTSWGGGTLSEVVMNDRSDQTN